MQAIKRRLRGLRLNVVDSHTAGEPTRVVRFGELPLLGATMAEQRDYFATHFDHVRTGMLSEPRSSDIVVGAVLTPAVNPGSAAGVVFCNNSGYLGMCGHGTIGVAATLRYLGLVRGSTIKLDTPVGTVRAEILDGGEVAVENVASYRLANDVKVEVPRIGLVVGDVAYGGNWFFIVKNPLFDISLSSSATLTETSLAIRTALWAAVVTGADGAEIDHVELLSESGRNFVLCPGGAYDRSPCGTGTSAKLACLFEDGKLKAGEWYVQESVAGTRFRGKVELIGGEIRPTIVGSAFITAQATLIFEERDPLVWGFGER